MVFLISLHEILRKNFYLKLGIRNNRMSCQERSLLTSTNIKVPL